MCVGDEDSPSLEDLGEPFVDFLGEAVAGRLGIGETGNQELSRLDIPLVVSPLPLATAETKLTNICQ